MDIPSDVGSKYKFLYFRNWQNKHREKEYMPKSIAKNMVWFNRMILSYSSNSVIFIKKHDSSDISVTGHRYVLDDWRSEKRNFSLRRHCFHWSSVPSQCPMHNVAAALSPWTKSSESETFHSLPFDSEVHHLAWCLSIFTRRIADGSHQWCNTACTTPNFNSWFLFDSASLVVRKYSTKILTHWGRVTQICVFNTRLFSLHNTLNYAIHRACLRMVLLTNVYRNLSSLWINL